MSMWTVWKFYSVFEMGLILAVLQLRDPITVEGS